MTPTTYTPLRLDLCYVPVLLTVFVLLQVIVDGIILSESDTDGSYSDNEDALDADDKDFVLHSSDSDIDQTFKELSPRVLTFVERSTPVAGQEEMTKQVKEAGDHAFVDEFLSSPTSTKMETEAQCFAHGYELAEKTDSRPYARIHRGHVMECKLKTHVKMREMVLSVGHDLVSRFALFSKYI